MIGKSTNSFVSELPRQIDVLRLYYNFSSRLSETKKISSIVNQIQASYEKRNVRVKTTETIRLKTKRLIKSCKGFIWKRMNCRKSSAERQRQEKCHRNIHGLFEVVENTQQKNPEGTNHETESSDECLFSNDEYLDDSFNNPDADPDYSPSEDECDNAQKPKISISNDIWSKLSKKKTSYRISESLLKLGVEISGADSDNYDLSKSNIWRKISELRSKQKKELLSLLTDSNHKIIVQFDGKTYPRLNQRHVGSDGRIIVLCHTENGDVALGLFTVNSHTGYECAICVTSAIERNCLNDRIVGMICDTENVNTGRFIGACTEIERLLEKYLLHLICRHHVLEVVLKHVFETIFGKSSGPTVTTFDMLKESWGYIKRNDCTYDPIEYEELRSPVVNEFFEEAIPHVNSDHLRNDYAELNDLVLKFFGIQTSKPFNVPGATSNARWMSRAIYALKTYLFRRHLFLDSNFLHSLHRFCLFVALIYTKHWNHCPNAADAPFNDLQLLKELDIYRQIDADVAESALESFKRHLWYLGDELVVLSLFSEKV